MIPRTSISAAVALLLAACPASALGASDATMTLSGPTTGVVGGPMVFYVSGNTPFDPDYGAAFWYSAGAIPTSVAAECPPDRSDGIQLANATGDVPVFTSQEPVDWDGNYSQTFGYVPSRPGTRLLCAYTTDLTGYTLARASMTLDVKAASTDGAPASGGTSQPAPAPAGPPPAAPAVPAPAPAAPPATTTATPTNTKAPRVSRAGSKVICNPGTWSGATGAYAYAWSVSGTPRKSPTGRTLRITGRMRGHRVACKVTASNAAGATTVVSAPITVGTRS